ncbi:hypothetical protein FQR65_LT07346 [Abscondita terminalis]|nr:hypothetical protein FQR65_LT07346 [Abscondita terminalis]
MELPLLAKRIVVGEIQERPKTPEALRQLLTYKEDLNLAETESFSGSEISDAFRDLHEGFVLSHAKGEKAIPKRDADRVLMEKFTENFKETMSELRLEMQISDNMMLESIDDIKVAQQVKRPLFLQEPIEIRIDDTLLEEKIKPRPFSSASSISKLSSASCDVNSGVWRMLKTGCSNDRFQVTPPNFNVFKQKEPHWLDRQAVPWHKLDDSKRKCEKWLTKYHK